jgi:hypothetical protein
LKEINSSLDIIVGQKIIFDLSDFSLSFNDGLQNKSAFSFDLYKDPNYNEKYYYNENGILEVIKTGNVGIDSGARLELNTTELTPIKLYYRLTPVIDNSLPEIKNEIYIDDTIIKNNSVNIFSSEYSGVHIITGIGSTAFNYQLQYLPEIEKYDVNNSFMRYSTNSKTAFGGIYDIKVISGGSKYKKLPGITTITSNYGKNAFSH